MVTNVIYRSILFKSIYVYLDLFIFLFSIYIDQEKTVLIHFTPWYCFVFCVWSLQVRVVSNFILYLVLLVPIQYGSSKEGTCLILLENIWNDNGLQHTLRTLVMPCSDTLYVLCIIL